MKPTHLIAGIGALLIVAVLGWYFYMESAPLYEQSPQRDLDPTRSILVLPIDEARMKRPAAPAQADTPAADGEGAAAGGEGAAAEAAQPTDATPTEDSPEEP